MAMAASLSTVQAKASLQKEAKVGTKVTNERHLAGSLRSCSVLSFCRTQSNDLEMLGGIGDNASEQVDHISIRGVRVNFTGERVRLTVRYLLTQKLTQS